jgi:Flp pilus assembly protein TadG
VAKSPAIAVRPNQSGQVLAFFALVLPAVLLPVAAYAVDATIVAARAAGLQAATAQAAEAAAQKLNVAAIRSSGALTLDQAATRVAVYQMLAEEEPGAGVDSSTVAGDQVTVVTSETVPLPFGVFARGVTLHARATARLVAGYDSPL